MEKLLIDLIRGLDVNAYKRIPEGPTPPFARVSLLGGPAANSTQPAPGYLNKATFQVDVWAETDPEAAEVADEIRVAVLSAPREQPVEGSVFSFTTAEYPVFLPDADWPVNGQPGPRYSMTVRVSAHPAP